MGLFSGVAKALSGKKKDDKEKKKEGKWAFKG